MNMRYQNEEDQQQTTTDEYEDKWITCKDCHEDFCLEAGEQAFLRRLEAEGKLDAQGKPVTYCEPKRCRNCRAARKANRR